MTPRRRSAGDASMVRALRRGEFERVALYLTLAAMQAARTAPQATIDDVLALLDEGTRDGGDAGGLGDDAHRRERR
jgi:hypothetical protein